MKAKTLSIKRSTLISAFLVGAVIAVCTATEVRADSMVLTSHAMPHHAN